MSTVYLVYTHYYDFETGTVSIGGVQTYIRGLLPVFASLGMSCRIYQSGPQDRQAVYDGTPVHEVCAAGTKSRDEAMRTIVSAIMKDYHNEEDLLIFLANEIACPNTASRSIALQHGISWDTLDTDERPAYRTAISFAMKSRRSYRLINHLNYVKRVVCVDHNFPNWLRSTAVRFKVPMTVIPNFTAIAPIVPKPEDTVNIIFARRFFPYRGTRIFVPAIRKLLGEYPQVRVTVAGSGPDEDYIRERLSAYRDRVTITRYAADETLQAHANQHIAAVPTVGSEGTSLSLLEAMSAQCAVISTDVGGLSNIVLDGYNGVFIEPDPESLYRALADLVEHPDKRRSLAAHAYETARDAFSYDLWCERWKRLIREMMG